MKTHRPTPNQRAAAWLFAALACTTLAHAAERKPNFLFIITDDQRWDAMGVVQKEQGASAPPGGGTTMILYFDLRSGSPARFEIREAKS